MPRTRSAFRLLALAVGSALVTTVAAPALAASKPSGTCKRCTADTTAPTVSISSPTSGATVGGTTSGTGTAGDAGGLAKVELQVDAGAWVAASGTSSWVSLLPVAKVVLSGSA